MANRKLIYGKFSNGVPYLRFGAGAKHLLFLLGGPGNTLPVGAATSGFIRGMQSFCAEYTVYLVSRKSGLPAGYTTQDMADDYAEMITNDFGGYVDVVIGFSFGGLILQHFAADHAHLAGHLVIGGAAHHVSNTAIQIDHQYAILVSQGRDREAMAERAAALFPPGIRRSLLAAMLWVFGKVLLGPVDSTFRNDVLIEAQAEQAHDSIGSLKRISEPILIVCGSDDFAFPLRDVQEMAQMIARATLKVYNQGHSTVFLDQRFVADVRAFVNQSQAKAG